MVSSVFTSPQYRGGGLTEKLKPSREEDAARLEAGAEASAEQRGAHPSDSTILTAFLCRAILK